MPEEVAESVFQLYQFQNYHINSLLWNNKIHSNNIIFTKNNIYLEREKPEKIVPIPNFNLHLHWIPSPSYPALHMHWYCPILVPHAHTACIEHLLLHRSLWLAISHTSGWESVKESQTNENIHQPSQSDKILNPEKLWSNKKHIFLFLCIVHWISR